MTNAETQKHGKQAAQRRRGISLDTDAGIVHQDDTAACCGGGPARPLQPASSKFRSSFHENRRPTGLMRLRPFLTTSSHRPNIEWIHHRQAMKGPQSTATAGL